MATIDNLIALLPQQWFSDDAKAPGGVLYAILSAIASLIDYVQSGINYVLLQTRIKTATDTNLDNIAADFFGPSGLLRKAGEADGSFEQRIINQIFLPKGTTPGIHTALSNLGCTVVEIYEPNFNGFFTDYSCLGAARLGDCAPYEAVFFVERPLNTSIINLFFTDYSETDYSYTIGEDVFNWLITDQDIYDVILTNKACGTQVYVVLDPVMLSLTSGGNATSTVPYFIANTPEGIQWINDNSPDLLAPLYYYLLTA